MQVIAWWLALVLLPGQAGDDPRVLLRAYADRPHELTIAGTFNTRAFISALDAELKGGLPGPAERGRRAVAAFALDAAAARLIAGDTPGGRALLEWGCQRVREHQPADDFDRQWHRAAAILAQAPIDPEFLERHLEHAVAHIGADPELTLALAIAGEQFDSPAFRRAGTAAATTHSEGVEAAQLDAALARRRAETLRRFERATANAATAGEAWLRIGHIHLAGQKFAEALEALAQVETATRDSWTRYLGHVFQGHALAATSRASEAADAYRRALAIGPTGQSATLSLAALLHAGGSDAAAATLVEQFLAEPQPIDDPWWSYWGGRSRTWDAVMPGLRAEIR